MLSSVKIGQNRTCLKMDYILGKFGLGLRIGFRDLKGIFPGIYQLQESPDRIGLILFRVDGLPSCSFTRTSFS